jgi:hypothetical protein
MAPSMMVTIIVIVILSAMQILQAHDYRDFVKFYMPVVMCLRWWLLQACTPRRSGWGVPSNVAARHVDARMVAASHRHV